MVVAAATAAHATLTYNGGGTTNITTAQPGQTNTPIINVTNATTVNWNTGASYDSTNNPTSGTVSTIALYDTSSFNLNGGSILNYIPGAGTAQNNGFVPQTGYTGSYGVSGGTFTLGKVGTNASAQIRFISSGAGGTFNMSGGTVNLIERGGAWVYAARVSGGAGVYNFSGGTINMSSDTAGVKFEPFQTTGGTPTINLSGTAFNLTGLTNIIFLNIANGTMNISGGTITANTNLTGSVNGSGKLVLNGTFTTNGVPVPNGVYTTNEWVNGPISGTLIDGSPFSLADLTLTNSTTTNSATIAIRQQAPLTWVGDGVTNAWDIATTANWTNRPAGGGLITFSDGDLVTFDDSSANTTVNLATTVSPGSVTVTNNVNNYTFSGGSIAGTGALTKQGTGSLTLSSLDLTNTGSKVIAGGTLVVDTAATNSLRGVSGAGNLTKAGAGVLTLLGANSLSGKITAQAGTLVVGTTLSGNPAMEVNGGATLNVTRSQVGSVINLSSLNFAAGSTSLTINDRVAISSSPIMSTANFTNAGTISVTYTNNTLPGRIVLIDYEAASSSVGGFAAPTLPAGYTGVIETNLAGSSIDLVITGVPQKTWAGGDISNPNLWDIGTTLNWNGGTATFADGDIVRFDDTSANTNINVNSGGQVSPGLMLVTNNAVDYTFQIGLIKSSALVKQGSGTMTMTYDNNSFSQTYLQGGTLAYQVTFATPVSASFSGPGTLRVGGTAAVTLSGDMSQFSGPIQVDNGTLICGTQNALGSSVASTTVTNGGTLELNGNDLDSEQVIVSGEGVGLAGAIVAGASGSVVSHITLAGDAVFGGASRWDISTVGLNNGILDTTGGVYTLTKRGVGIVSIATTTISTNIGDIIIENGTLMFGNGNPVNLGNASRNINVKAAGRLRFFNNTGGQEYNQVVNLQEAGATFAKNGTDPVVFTGPVNLAADAIFDNISGTFTISNTVSGVGGVTKTGDSPITLALPSSYSGATTISNGTFNLTTGHSGGGAFTVIDGATLGVRVSSAGSTLNTTSLTLGATGGVVTVTCNFGVLGNPTAPLINAAAITVNASTNNFNVQADTNLLTPGTMTLLQYPAGQFTSNVSYTLPAGVSGYVTNNTALGKVQLVVLPPPVVTNPPPVLTNSFASGQVVFSWGSGYKGYTLQTQTNQLNVGLSTNWVAIPGTETVTGYTQAVNKLNPSVFFRLVYTNTP